jgi:hypothetical protein
MPPSHRSTRNRTNWGLPLKTRQAKGIQPPPRCS